MERKLVQAFATPVGFFVVPDHEALNSELKRIILDREQTDGGIERSNVGGWHSATDFLDWPQTEIGALRKCFIDAVQFIHKETGQEENQQSQFHYRAWANVCRHGDYHTIHNHPDAIWSGSYYVDAGGDAPGRPLSGQLEFLDPRPGVDMIVVPGSPYGRGMLFKPQAGALVLFPSWLYHQVHPFYGEGVRISISFNASRRGIGF